MRILSTKQVSIKTSLSPPQIRRMSSSGKLPKPIQLSKARIGWVEADIDDWIQSNAGNKEVKKWR